MEEAVDVGWVSLDYTEAPLTVVLRRASSRGVSVSDLLDELDICSLEDFEISPSIALALERVLGRSSEYWNNLYANYRVYCGRSQ